jgi:hypothetical protein
VSEAVAALEARADARGRELAELAERVDALPQSQLDQLSLEKLFIKSV